MRIEYDNTFFDISYFWCIQQFTAVAVQGFYIVVAIFIGFLEATHRSGIMAVTIAVCIWGAMWLAQVLFNLIYMASKDNRTLLTKHVIEIRDEGLFEETPFNRSIFFWPGIMKIAAYPGYLAIYISGHQAHVIPRRAFTSPKDVQAFRDLAVQHLGLSRAQGLR